MNSSSPAEITSVQFLNRLSITECSRLFQDLGRKDNANNPLPHLEGEFRSAFIGPGWLRLLAGPALAIGGLGGWIGKRFDPHGTGVNLVIRQSQIREVLPVTIEIRPSRLDSRPCLAVLYLPSSPFPWMHIQDELRPLNEIQLLGLTFADLPLLRGSSFPFLLTKADQ